MTKSSIQMEDKANWSRQAYTHYVLFSDDLYFQSFGTHFLLTHVTMPLMWDWGSPDVV